MKKKIKRIIKEYTSSKSDNNILSIIKSFNDEELALINLLSIYTLGKIPTKGDITKNNIYKISKLISSPGHVSEELQKYKDFDDSYHGMEKRFDQISKIDDLELPSEKKIEKKLELMKTDDEIIYHVQKFMEEHPNSKQTILNNIHKLISKRKKQIIGLKNLRGMSDFLTSIGVFITLDSSFASIPIIFTIIFLTTSIYMHKNLKSSEKVWKNINLFMDRISSEVDTTTHLIDRE